jgi:hypothetical protein
MLWVYDRFQFLLLLVVVLLLQRSIYRIVSLSVGADVWLLSVVWLYMAASIFPSMLDPSVHIIDTFVPLYLTMLDFGVAFRCTNSDFHSHGSRIYDCIVFNFTCYLELL